MGVTEAAHAEVIAAPAEECLAALLDVASYPNLQSAVKDAGVLEDGDDPVVEFRIDAKLKTVRYVLRYHPEPPSRLWWEYVEGDVKSVSGSYELDDLGDGTTRATYRLAIDPGLLVPGVIKKA